MIGSNTEHTKLLTTDKTGWARITDRGDHRLQDVKTTDDGTTDTNRHELTRIFDHRDDSIFTKER